MSSTDDKIAAIIKRRSAGPEQDFKITREEGATPMPANQPAGPGQIDSTIRFSEWQEPAKPSGIRVANSIVMQDTREVAPSEVVKVSDTVTLAPSGLSGWERVLTRGASDWAVRVDGEVVRGNDAMLAAIYSALREQQQQQQTKKAGK